MTVSFYVLAALKHLDLETETSVYFQTRQDRSSLVRPLCSLTALTVLAVSY